VAAAPGSCTGDAECRDGERCNAGRCAPSTETCGLVRVRFAFDSAQLDEAATQALREDAQCLARRAPPALVVEGHCDERGTTQYNVVLGARRAEAVRRYLADLGVKTRFDTVSFGKELPVAQGSGEAAWAQNRRAELRLPGDRRSDGQLVAGR
jgi:peptidoglycan-associated lipoprotein